jgi:NADPH:quinone reductase-like Zn-dependent oxidoreductase
MCQHDPMREVMSAAVLTRHGDSEALEVRTDWPRPVPGAGQVLVRVGAAAVNNTDIWTREGAYGLPGRPDALAGWRGPLRFPLVQGGDIAGVVTEVGPGVDSSRTGQRVLVDPALYRDEGPHAPPVGLLGSEADGGFAEYVAVPAAQAHDVTGSPLSDVRLACLPVAYGTAMGMLERAGVGAGESVLVTGASGGVGLALVQLAAARGADVVAVTASAKAAEVTAAGASRVISRDHGDLAEQLAVAVPDGLDVVADVAGGPLVEQVMPLLKDDGRWVIAGAVAGPVISFDLRRLYLHNIRLIGSSMHTRAHFAKLVDAARNGTVDPVVAGVHPLTAIHEAQRQFRAGEHVGKIVLSGL